jgi:hypothetical protein
VSIPIKNYVLHHCRESRRQNHHKYLLLRKLFSWKLSSKYCYDFNWRNHHDFIPSFLAIWCNIIRILIPVKNDSTEFASIVTKLADKNHRNTYLPCKLHFLQLSRHCWNHRYLIFFRYLWLEQTKLKARFELRTIIS